MPGILEALSGAGNAVGFITQLFEGSGPRQSQVAQREQDAKDNGYKSFKEWDAAGQPWTAVGIVKHHTRLGLPLTEEQLKAAGYAPATTAATILAGEPRVVLDTNGNVVNPAPGTKVPWYKQPWVKIVGFVAGGVTVFMLLKKFVFKKKRRRY